MRLTQNNDVVHTLASDRSDQPFGNAILPWGHGSSTVLSAKYIAAALTNEYSKWNERERHFFKRFVRQKLPEKFYRCL